MQKTVARAYALSFLEVGILKVDEKRTDRFLPVSRDALSRFS